MSALSLLSLSILMGALGCGKSGDGVPSGGTGGRSSTAQSGGSPGTGGTTGTTTNPGTGGAAGGQSGSAGGAKGTGGATSAGGVTEAGGVTGSGGVSGTGGLGAGGNATGGTTANTGGKGGATGGTQGTGGTTSTGSGGNAGKTGSGGSAPGSGGSGGSAGTTGAGGSTSAGTLPGDIAKAAGTPMVAAHSMTRAMFDSYTGPLFKALRVSDKQEKDIGIVAATGLVDLSDLSTFCSATTCKVSTLYDQSGNGNDMWKGDTAANAPMDNGEAAKLCDLLDIEYWQMSDGTKVPLALEHGYEAGKSYKSPAQCLRNRDKAKNMPKGASPLTQYSVFHNKYANDNCCFNYGSTGNKIHYTGPGTLSALNFSRAAFWTKGIGTGPWVMVDFEQGVYAGNIAKSSASVPTSVARSATGENPNPTITYDIVTALMKHNGVSHWALKAANAKSGDLAVSIDLSSLPNGYSPLKQEGGLGLGEGGAGDSNGAGGFSEGAVIAAETTDATDNAIQKSIVSVFGK
ncbi:MAG TPA: arabinofuranosidase catalytic domain-containing protein [Polyangia bacterium]